MRDRGRIYDLERWDRTRRLVLREEPVCRHCLAIERTSLSTDVDHIIPMSEGGDAWDRVNLQGLCRECHSRKTVAELKRMGIWGVE